MNKIGKLLIIAGINMMLIFLISYFTAIIWENNGFSYFKQIQVENSFGENITHYQFDLRSYLNDISSINSGKLFSNIINTIIDALKPVEKISKIWQNTEINDLKSIIQIIKNVFITLINIFSLIINFFILVLDILIAILQMIVSLILKVLTILGIRVYAEGEYTQIMREILSKKLIPYINGV